MIMWPSGDLTLQQCNIAVGKRHTFSAQALSFAHYRYVTCVRCQNVCQKQLLKVICVCVVLLQLIQHVQHLFECPSLEGLLPTINKVYVRYNELGSFFRALASLLALPHDAGPGAAVAKISKIIKQAGRWAVDGPLTCA